MGRPLNKKYFGNRNIGTGGHTSVPGGNIGGDDGIGGEGLTAYTAGASKGLILIDDTYRVFPTLTIPSPDLPGGVASTGTPIWEASTVTITTGTGYTTGTITSITGLDAQATTATRFTVTVDGSGFPTFNAFTSRGEYTSIDGTGITTWNVVGPTGSNAQATVTFRLKSVTTGEKGSGYTSVPTLSWTRTAGFGGGQAAPTAPTVSLTTDSGGFLGSGNNVGGNVNAATQQDNAIVIRANTDDAGAKIGDIRKQKGSRRYQVRTADGIATCKLVADDTPAVGEAYITATDLGGATYWVTKLTAHRATIVPKGVGSPQFPLVDGEPQHVGWTFGTAVAPATNVLGKVTIENA